MSVIAITEITARAGHDDCMVRYLVVAHRTGDSPTLLAVIQRLAKADPAVEFAVLTPRRPLTLTMLAGGEKRSATQVALWRGRRTAERLRKSGARVVATRLGGHDPFQAIMDELKLDHYAGVIISTLPPGFSTWLRLDLPSRLKRRWPDLDVIHVVTPSSFFLEGDAVEASMADDRGNDAARITSRS
jgi:hypothetical protein